MKLTFKQFLAEDTYEGASRVTELDLEEAIELIEKNCGDYLKSPGRGHIFRGFKRLGNAWIGDSNTGSPRVSANTFNYYTLWMDNHPSWAGFPKRSRSFICSESDELAVEFGKVYMIFPYDDAKLAACPENDLWISFKGIATLAGLLRDVNEGFKALKIEAPDTYDELVKALKELTEEKIYELITKLRQEKKKEDAFLQPLIGKMIDFDSTSMYGVFEKALVPTDFIKWPSPREYKNKDDREVFIQGKCIFIRMGLVVGSNKNERVEEFLKKHNIKLF